MKKFVIQNIKCQFLGGDMTFSSLDKNLVMLFDSEDMARDVIDKNKIENCEVGLVDVDENGVVRPKISLDQYNFFITNALTEKELDKYLNKIKDSSEIDFQRLSSFINDDINNHYSSRIFLNQHQSKVNSLWWLAYMGSVIANHGNLVEILNSSLAINSEVITYSCKPLDQSKEEFHTSSKNLSLYQPIKAIFEELCNILKNMYLYQTFLSVLMRQLIEIYLLNKELEINKVGGKMLLDATIASHNKQCGSDNSMFSHLNLNNPGLFKVFISNISIGKLAKKYHLGFAYSFFSGDIHSYASIEKLLPSLGDTKTKFNEVYLDMCFSLVKLVISYLISKNENLKTLDLNLHENISILDK